MKKLLKNNQLIITALAILIVIAGYLNYVQKVGDENDYESVMGDDVMTGDMLDMLDISESDILNEQLAAGGTEDELLLQNNEETQAVDSQNVIDSPDGDLEPADSDMPGEAVLTSGTMNVNNITEVKLKREQSKSLQKTSLMEIINSESVTEEQKQDAINELLEVNTISGKEAEAELLLEAKGFRDVVVSITNGSVDVVVNANNLSDVDRAQIEDIVKRKTEISADKIIITPFIAKN
ncbi:MAG: SpoIIIAH-like family protein [Lachnospiraceae bacterium]|nr:SpoIIIAH-like family protein [Lachnospiraceae bacterium]